MRPNLAALALFVPLGLSACGVVSKATTDSALPAREKTVTDQVLAFDSAKDVGGDPSCTSRKIASTEVTIPFAQGSQGASGQWTERWTVDRCGRQVPYLVNYMRAPDGHLGVNIMRLEGIDGAVIPGNSLADRVLQRDVFLLIAQKDLSELEGGPCRTRQVSNTELVSPLEGSQVEEGKPVAGQWSERWTLDRCGASVHYIVHFVTTRSGTRFSTGRESASAPGPTPAQPAAQNPPPPSSGPIVERREPAPSPGAASPQQPAAPVPPDSGAAIDWLLQPRGR